MLFVLFMFAYGTQYEPALRRNIGLTVVLELESYICSQMDTKSYKLSFVVSIISNHNIFLGYELEIVGLCVQRYLVQYVVNYIGSFLTKCIGCE